MRFDFRLDSCESTSKGFDLEQLASQTKIDNTKVLLDLTELEPRHNICMGRTQRLANLVGRSKTLDMILFIKRVELAKALEMVFVDRLAIQDTLTSMAMGMAISLAQRPPILVRCVLKSYGAGRCDGLNAGLDTEANGPAAVRDTEDC